MKTSSSIRLCILVFGLLLVAPGRLYAQGTAFTYQGRLNDSGSPANGNYDLEFTLFDAATTNGNQIGGTVTNLGVSVNNGLFTTTIDFGSGIFTGNPLWLQIGVETNGGGGNFTLLGALQPLTPTPYSIYAASAGTAASAATATTASSVSAGSITGGSIASGQVVKSVNGLTDGITLAAGANVTIIPTGNTLTINSAGGGGPGSGWSLTGNAATTAGTNFLGTIDNQPLELHVNGARALRLEPDVSGDGAPNVIEGSQVNFVAHGVVGATIGGGGAVNYFGSGVAYPNSVTGTFGTVGGGLDNTAADLWATVGGGFDNTASVNSATVSGGNGNTANDQGATVGGGFQNTAGNSATVAGGFGNRAVNTGAFVGGGGYDGSNVSGNTASGAAATVAGGLGNLANNTYATVGGGIHNSAGGLCATVGGGTNNNASGPGAFVGGGGFDGFVFSGNIASGGGSTVAGGIGNTSSATVATVGGGGINIATFEGATVGGGENNNATGEMATIPGGFANTAAGTYSFAAGRGAQANHQGAFVWADSQSGYFSSTGSNQFCIRAQGGVTLSDSTPYLYFGTTTRQMIDLYSSTYGIGVQNSDMYYRSGSDFFWYVGGSHNDGFGNAGGGIQLMHLANSGNLVVAGSVTAQGVTLTSDRNSKEHFQAVDTQNVLEKVAALPMSEWQFKTTPDGRHLGPMAQDFRAAFGLGADDKHIAVMDEGGVALAAIQGLNQKLEQQSQAKDAEIQNLKQQNEFLAQRLNQLEAMVTSLAEKK